MAISSKPGEKALKQTMPGTGEEIQLISAETTSEESLELSVRKKLTVLYTLQTYDTQIDKIRSIRGELPLEVQDLEDEIAGLETRIGKFRQEVEEMEVEISGKKISIKQSQDLIKKYEGQQTNVRNNREYDSLSKEIEFQSLEIQLCEKNIREFTASLELKTETVKEIEAELDDRKKDLEVKKSELSDIVTETRKEEEVLLERSEEQKRKIEPRLLSAYQRIRANARNGLAVVPVERDACGGCYNKIPPQRQLDIRLLKKIIVCEYCGRILVDQEMLNINE
ncbi:MAG TPA: C4-type zinc ribbon domain-containing protein [Bacteroidales bacterium]|nr:C4-type zinc ribbon domain-containing protein [Bacteroidales bacterium]